MKTQKQDFNKTFTQVVDLIHKMFGTDKNEISQDSRFYEDLGMNSLERADFFCDVEPLFDITIEEEPETVGDLVEQILSYENEQELG